MQKPEKSTDQNYIDIWSRLRQLTKNPLELFSVLKTALTTCKYRYILRCAGSGTIVGFNTNILNFSNVEIGENSLILDHVYMRAGANGHITLGGNVAINSFAKFFGHGGITVGNYSQIGPGSLLTTTQHDISNAMEVIYEPIELGEWVWVGANCTILSGVKIGDRTVVGAGSVVTKSLPANCVAVGVPARVIKYHNGDEPGQE